MAIKLGKGQVVQVPARTFGRGSGDTVALKLAFPTSPLNDGTYSTDEQVVQKFLNPPELQNGQLSDGGYAFGTVNRYYQDAPDLATVQVGGGGLPGTPWAPNIASPSAVDNPQSIPDSGVEATNRLRGDGTAFQGNGLTSPSVTTAQITSKKLGDILDFGKITRI